MFRGPNWQSPHPRLPPGLARLVRDRCAVSPTRAAVAPWMLCPGPAASVRRMPQVEGCARGDRLTAASADREAGGNEGRVALPHRLVRLAVTPGRTALRPKLSLLEARPVVAAEGAMTAPRLPPTDPTRSHRSSFPEAMKARNCASRLRRTSRSSATRCCRSRSRSAQRSSLRRALWKSRRH